MRHLPTRTFDVPDLLSQDTIADNVHATDKRSLLMDMAKRAAVVTRLDMADIFELLLQRERLSSTGFGNGVAIPHIRSCRLNTIHGMFFRLKKPVDFDAIDNEPVDLVFLLMTPEEAGADHLRALSRISRLLKDQSLCEKVRHCTGTDCIYSLLTEVTETAMAA